MPSVEGFEENQGCHHLLRIARKWAGVKRNRIDHELIMFEAG